MRQEIKAPVASIHECHNSKGLVSNKGTYGVEQPSLSAEHEIVTDL